MKWISALRRWVIHRLLLAEYPDYGRLVRQHGGALVLAAFGCVRYTEGEHEVIVFEPGKEPTRKMVRNELPPLNPCFMSL